MTNKTLPCSVKKACFLGLVGMLPVMLIILVASAGTASRWNMDVFLHRSLAESLWYVGPIWLVVGIFTGFAFLGGAFQNTGGGSYADDDSSSDYPRATNPATGLPTVGGHIGAPDIGGHAWGGK